MHYMLSSIKHSIIIITIHDVLCVAYKKCQKLIYFQYKIQLTTRKHTSENTLNVCFYDSLRTRSVENLLIKYVKIVINK